MTDANDEALLGTLVAALTPVRGIAAIAQGGSRARGTATPSSDYDIGLYYGGDHPIDVEALGRVAIALDDRGAEASVTPIGGWRPWIDGGGWLVVQRLHVDLLYRNLDRVAAAIDDAHAGKVERYYQPGHPHEILRCAQDDKRNSRSDDELLLDDVAPDAADEPGAVGMQGLHLG